MTQTPLIRKGIVRPMVSELVNRGARLDRVLGQAGIRSEDLTRPDEDMEEWRAFRLLDLSAAHVDDPAFGARAGLATEFEDLGVFGRQLEYGLTLHHALAHFLSAVNSVSSHARFWLEREAAGVWLCRKGIVEIHEADEQAELYTLGFITRLARLSAPEGWSPTRLQLKASDVPLADVRAYWPEAEVEQACDRTAILLPSALLHRRVAPPDDSPLLVRLRRGLGVQCAEGLPTLEALAEELGTSRRTLQRSLNREGLNYRVICDRVRFDLAARLLRETDLPIQVIALEAGYEDPANFVRAFRRWTGQSPTAWRAETSSTLEEH